MFEDIDRIQWLEYSEYKRAIYYLNHPSEYYGDFDTFRDKLIDYSDRLEKGEIDYGDMY